MIFLVAGCNLELAAASVIPAQRPRRRCGKGGQNQKDQIQVQRTFDRGGLKLDEKSIKFPLDTYYKDSRY